MAIRSPSPLEFTDHTPSTLSEIDSLSDSDWLDLASNKESDDNDSLCSRDSDHEGPTESPQRSRRSSISNASSTGVVEAWEGFVEEATDNGLVDALNSPLSIADDPLGGNVSPKLPQEHDIAEDQRVKQALDQSMISTLSSSRSSVMGGPPHSVHTSLRDLRLSFPDPLTSSRDQLSISYQNLSRSETPCSQLEDDAADGNARDLTMIIASENSPSGHFVPDVDIFLYGFSPSEPSSFVDMLLQKAALGAGVTLSSDAPVGSTRLLHVQGKNETSTSFPNVIAVIDTTENSQHNPTIKSSLGRPSLALIYLPSQRSIPRGHTYYLPVLASSFDNLDDRFDLYDAFWTRAEAQHDWDAYHIPHNRVLPLKRAGESAIVEYRDLQRINLTRVYHVFKQVTAGEAPKCKRAFRDHLTSIHFMTITLAFLFMVLASIVGLSFYSMPLRASPMSHSPPAPSTTPSWHRPRPLMNHSVTQPTVFPEGSSGMVPLSLKDFALAVFHSSSSMPRVSASSRLAPVLSAAPSMETNEPQVAERLSWADSFQSTKDLILRPASALSNSPISTSSDSLPVAQTQSPITKSVNLRLPTTLVKFIDMRIFIFEALRRDFKDLLETLDGLMQAVSRQTADVVRRSKGTAQDLRQRLEARHTRAQVQARKLKEMGGRLLSSASETILGRANVAKDKARTLRENIVASDMWSEYHARLKEVVEIGHGSQKKWGQEINQRLRRRRDTLRKRRSALS